MKLNKLIALLSLTAVVGVSAQAMEESAPTLLSGNAPEFTQEARAAGLQGVVVVEALIDEQGRVIAAEVIQSVHPSLDKATLEAVRQWQFSPAMVDGKAVMKVVHIPVSFQLVDPERESVRMGTLNTVALR